MAKRLKKNHALLQFMFHHKAIRPYLYTTNQLERVMKEVGRRTKVLEVFCGPKSVMKLLHLVLVELNGRLFTRRLKGFAKI